MQRIKWGILFLLTMGLLFIPTMAWGLYSPTVSNGHGDVTARDVDNLGWIVGGEYGVMDNLAIIADIGEDDYSRVGIKIAINPEIAFIGGVLKSSLFLGADYGTTFTDNLTGIAELNVYQSDDQVTGDYEVGCKYNLSEEFDLRAGLMGTIDKSDISYNFELGFGYSF